MNYKEFYIWLEGYLQGRLENEHISIGPIIEKMSKVKGENYGFDIEKFRSQRPKPLTIKNLNTEYDK
jgi:hypothetical protein